MTIYSFFVSLVAALGGFLFGYHTSIISGALLFLSRDFSLTTVEQELVVSTLLIGAMLGAVVGGFIANRVGRKKTLLITVVLFFVGTLVISDATGFASLLVGRFITGIAIGIASMAVPLYISEMAPPKSRGALVSLNQLMIAFGILVAYFVQFLFSETREWRQMFAFALIPISIQFLGLFFIPETKPWLERDKTRTEKHSLRDLFKPEMRNVFWIGIAISVFQQITGINTIIYYSPKIFEAAGNHTIQSSIEATLVIGIINMLFTVVALWLIDRVGRRALLLIGLGGMALSLAVLGIVIGIRPDMALMAVLAYVAFFAISLGPIVWLIISEIYLFKVRSLAMGVATFANWLCNFLVSVTFLSLVSAIGLSSTFWLYMAISIFAFVFVWKKIPETKGKTFEQIQQFFKDRR